MRRLFIALSLATLLTPAPGVAQAPGGAGRPGKGSPGRKPQPKKAEPEAPETIRLKADVQEMVEEGHYRARGFADLQAGSIRLQADEMDLYQTKAPDGSESRRLLARGNVVFLQGEERISGESLEMDLITGKGTFQDAMGYVQPGVFVEARTIERVDPDTYRVRGAKFTSCSQPNPRWSFGATSATIDVDDKIVARNVLFKVKSVPAFYAPIFLYPIREDQRSTGFLFPHFGYTSLRGFELGSGFFWAMGRSFDQTFYADRYSKYGYGLGHELRYALQAPSRATLRSYFFRPKEGDQWDYDLNWNAVQALPAQFRLNVQVNRSSNQTFRQQIQDDLDLATTRTRSAAATLSRGFAGLSFQAVARADETFFGDLYRVNRRLPSVRLSRSSGRIAGTPLVFGFEARGESLELGDQDTVGRYARYDVGPELSTTFATPFLQLTPRTQVRYTRYSKSRGQGGELVDEPIERRYFEGSAEMLGPRFSRVFNTGWLGGYTDKIKHVVGPEVVYTYRTPVDEFDQIPRFDEGDQYPGTNQIQYGLVQRLFSRRKTAAGKMVPQEFFLWRVIQTYYFEIGNNQNQFDPNYTSSAFGPGGTPDHNSPIHSRMRFKPSPAFNTNFDLEYDVNFRKIRRLSLSSGLRTPRLDLQAGWNRRRQIQVRAGASDAYVTDTIRGSARLALVPRRLVLHGSADYNLVQDKLIQTSARLRYDVQCCGFTVEVIQYDLALRDERQFRISIDLANIGSIGNFNGEGAGGLGGGGALGGSNWP